MTASSKPAGYAIREANASDTAEIARMISKIEQYYGAEPITDLSEVERQTATALFSDNPIAKGLLCHFGQELIGFASYSYHWPAAIATNTLFLKELFVVKEHRRQGVATYIMDTLIQIANEEMDCVHIEWTADSNNDLALSFYEQLGYEPKASKTYFRWTKPTGT